MVTLIRCPFNPRVTAVARKRPRSFCQKYRRQVTSKNAYTLDPTKSGWADYAAVQAQCGNLSGNELTRNSSGNIRQQSSQFAEPLWTDPSQKCGIGIHELISIRKKRGAGGGGGGGENLFVKFSPIMPRMPGKSHHHRATGFTCCSLESN